MWGRCEGVYCCSFLLLSLLLRYIYSVAEHLSRLWLAERERDQPVMRRWGSHSLTVLNNKSQKETPTERLLPVNQRLCESKSNRIHRVKEKERKPHLDWAYRVIADFLFTTCLQPCRRPSPCREPGEGSKQAVRPLPAINLLKRNTVFPLVPTVVWSNSAVRFPPLTYWSNTVLTVEHKQNIHYIKNKQLRYPVLRSNV